VGTVRVGRRLAGPPVRDDRPAASSAAGALKDAVESTRDSGTGRRLTLAVGYGGWREIVEAARAVLQDCRDPPRPSSPASCLRRSSTKGSKRPGPDPELVIRISGEQHLLLPALPKVLEAAFAGGASQVTLQVRRDA